MKDMKKLRYGAVRQIEDGIKELKELETLENCNLPEEIKKEMKSWVTWIGVYAQKIEDAMNDDLWDGYYYDE